MGARIRPVPPGEPVSIGLAVSSVRTQRVGTARVELHCGDRVLVHDFEVIDMFDSYLIGLDIFAQCGFYVGGVPSHWPGPRAGAAEARAAAIEEQHLRERPKPWALEHRANEQDLALLSDAISDLTIANAQLDPSKPACPSIPEATLVLPMLEAARHARATFRQQYPVARAAQGALDKQMDKWSAQDCFEPAQDGNYNTPYMATGKKDLRGEKTDWRICFDFRHVNALLSAADYAGAVPRVQDLLRRVEGFTFASCLDLSSAYQQLPIAPHDRHKTAFTYNNRRLQWKRWPFGLYPATAQFQRVMEKVMDGLEGVIIYVDDICVVSKGDMAEHAALVAEVLRRLNTHGLRLNLDKCHFGFKRILLLGHHLSGSNQAMDPLKASQVLDWPEPTTGKAMMRFLGFTNFVRNYVPRYAQLAQPLDALRLTPRFTMNDQQRRHFLALKETLNRAPVLSVPDPDLPLQVATDASQLGLGAVLYQHEEGKPASERRYIAFASKALNGAQANYPATKRELLAVVFALREFSQHLLGRRFILYTDHQALTSIFTSSSLSYVVANWLDVLLEYDFEIRHRPGVQMVLPDALSRIYSETTDEAGGNDADACSTTTDNAPHIKALSTIEDPDDVERQLQEFISQRLSKKSLATESERLSLLRGEHASNHFGAEQLFRSVWRKGYFWPGMHQQCTDVVGHCRTCLQHNAARRGFHPVQSLRADQPWDHVAMDLAVDLPRSRQGNAHILIVVDVNTRYVVTKPLADTKMKTVARALFEIFAIFGPPRAMQSDRGPEFVNQLVDKLSTSAGVDQRFVAPWNPRANGLAERTVRTVKESLRKRLEGAYDRWDDALPGITWAINTKDHALTKTAPFTLFFARGAGAWADSTVVELKMQLEHAPKDLADPDPEAVLAVQNQQKEFKEVVRPVVEAASRRRQDSANKILDRKRPSAPQNIRPGCLVYVEDEQREGKNEARFVGPFLVNRMTRAGTFFLDNLSGECLPVPVPVSRLRFVADTNLPLTAADGSVLEMNAERGTIHRILQHRESRLRSGETEYLVSWTDKSPDSWIPASAFDDQSAVAKYHRLAHPAKKTNKKRAAPASSAAAEPPAKVAKTNQKQNKRSEKRRSARLAK